MKDKKPSTSPRHIDGMEQMQIFMMMAAGMEALMQQVVRERDTSLLEVVTKFTETLDAGLVAVNKEMEKPSGLEGDNVVPFNKTVH